MDLRCVYKYLQLEAFDNPEFDRVFDKIRSSAIVNDDEILDISDTSNDSLDTEQELLIDQQDMRDFLVQRIIQLEQDNGLPSAHDEETTNAMRVEHANQEASRILHTLFDDNSIQHIDKQLFSSKLLEKASSVDMKRTLPITISMLLVGSSVGIITPVMPFVVENLGLTPGQYGMVVSAFAAAKMSCNVPSAILVERHGRKV